MLQDEICTSLLDVEPVTTETLNFVMKHVMEATPLRSSCILDIIDLNFVYASAQSHEKFVQEFSKLKLPCVNYVLCKEADLHYLVKNNQQIVQDKDFVINDVNLNYTKNVSNGMNSSTEELINCREVVENKHDYKHEVNSQQSDISSVNGSEAGTNGG